MTKLKSIFENMLDEDFENSLKESGLKFKKVKKVMVDYYIKAKYIRYMKNIAKPLKQNSL